MADYFTRGVVRPSLPLTEEQRAVMLLYTDEVSSETPEEDLLPGEKLFLEIFPESEDCWGGSLGLAREKDGEEYYLFAEESLGDMDLRFLQHVLDGLDSEKYPYITVEYAHTCSKMRPDGWGGGAWFITREGVEYVNTGSWLEKKITNFKQKKGGE